jgi:2-pyrone-4,6-dicarboxylate lactonase
LCPPPHPSPKKPDHLLPSGSCDAHCHVFGPVERFPYARDRTFTPAEAPLEALQSLHRHLGIERAVIVQSACYGADHGALLDALSRGGGSYKGIALIGPATSNADLREFDSAGIRGARLNFLPHLGTAPSRQVIQDSVARVERLGWHAQIHVSADGIASHFDLIKNIPVPVMIDHLARVDLSPGQDSIPIRALFTLLDSGNVWIKLSGVDRLSKSGPPYDDAVELAARVIAHAPERVVWGTDFPHTNILGEAPDDGLLVDLLETIAPATETRHRLLVTNPEEFYGFV